MQAANRIRVILADDHELVRSGVGSLLGQLPDVEVIAEASDGAELVRLAEALVPDVAITDLEMPGMDGVEAIRRLRASGSPVRCLVLSMSDSVAAMREAAAAGAAGYLMKSASVMELGVALRAIMERGTYFSPAIASRLLAPADPRPQDVLTERQLEILKLLAQGLAAKEIAFQLNLSSKTIDTHRARIMERLEISDLPSLTRYAIRHRIVTR